MKTAKISLLLVFLACLAAQTAWARGGGGCFLPGTPVTRGDGSTAPIESLAPGDVVLAFTPDGKPVQAKILGLVSIDADEYTVLSTAKVTLRATAEHPFFVGEGTFKNVEALREGDVIFAYDGTGLSPQRIESLKKVRERTKVFNLQTDEPNTFFAAGIAVHNKGGGGGGGRSSTHSSGSTHTTYSGGAGSSDLDPFWTAILVIFAFLCPTLFIVIVLVRVIRGWNRAISGNLDVLIPRSRISPKANKTRELLEYLATRDLAMMPDSLVDLARQTFIKLQQCWQERRYDPMKPLMMPDLYAQHCAQLAGMVRTREINLIEGLVVESVDLVNVRYTNDPGQREFTALITATARDYYVQESSRKFLRGDMAPARFQEFWVFHYVNGKWLLREIEQSAESDALKDENFYEIVTDVQFNPIFGGKPGRAVKEAAREKKPKDRAGRIDTLLEALAKSDRTWDRESMKAGTRLAFIHVTMARQSGDAQALKQEELYPETAAMLKDEIAAMKADGLSVEYRNFCIRKVDLVLVRNFTDNSRDEYTARITAHALKVRWKNGQVVGEDPYVSPYEEYWTFGRLGGGWKLKEILPPASGRKAASEKIVDEDRVLS